MAKKYIDPKRPPLIWDTIEDAFGRINDNFTELYLTIGGGSPVDLSNISTSINPSESTIFDLGTPSARWRRLYIGGGAIYVENAPITANGSTLELPPGTKVGGTLIKDPAEGSFKTIQTFGSDPIVAEDLKDTLTLVGNGITISTNAATDSISFTNAGVTSAVAGTGISVNAATGSVTITNTGVTSTVAGTGIGVSSGTGAVTISNTGVTQLIAGSNIILSGSTGAITITNGSPNILQNLWRYIAVSGEDTLDPLSANSILTFVAGSNIVLTTNATTNTVTISSPNVQDIVGSIFSDDSTLLVNGVDGKLVGPVDTMTVDTDSLTVIVDATINDATFTGTTDFGSSVDWAAIIGTSLNATGLPIFTDAQDLDIKGSVFADDSSMVIDGTSGRVVGPVYTSTLRTSEISIALGELAGSNNQGSLGVAIGRYSGQLNQGTRSVGVGFNSGNSNQGAYSVAIGTDAGATTQGTFTVAIGSQAGQSNQGNNAVAIGRLAGTNNQSANSIVINASGVVLNGSAAGFYVDPIRSTASASAPLMYNSTTKELFYNPTLEFVGSTISTNDSSGIRFDVQTTFQTAVTVDDDLTVNGNIVGYINLATLKSVVAASSSFTDFQTRIAAL